MSLRLSFPPHTLTVSPSLQVFVVEVGWSADTSFTENKRATVYRSHNDFFAFQCNLLLDFPDEAGERARPRVIPYLPGMCLVLLFADRLRVA